jgi:FkbM family methyltransferase
MISKFYKYYARLFAWSFLFPIHRALYGLSLRGMGVMNYSDSHTSGEAYLLERLGALGTIETAIDIGANEGAYTMLILEYLEPKNIYCIEAHPKTCDRLRSLQSTKSANIHVLHYAISESDHGQKELYDYDHSGSSQASLIKNVSETFFSKSANKFIVPAISIDELAKKHGIQEIGLLKIDIEGAEYSALKGASKLLATQSIDYIQFEFNEMNILSGAYMKDFIALLAGYDLYRLLPRGLIPIRNYSPRLHEIFAFQNILAVRHGMPI